MKRRATEGKREKICCHFAANQFFGYKKSR
jgi:hypothetical protein